MSLSWRDAWTAVLTPGEVALVRRPRGWRRLPQLHAHEVCAAPTPQAAVDALRVLLAQPEVTAGALTLLLSNHFAQYLLVPWRAEVGSPAELAAYAGVCFDETFGNESGARELRIAPERAGGPRLAVSLDTGFLHALRAAVSGSRLALASIQPYLPAAFDRLQGTLPARDFMFVLAEPARSCVLVATGGRWRSLRSSAGAARPRDLAQLIEREAQLAGLAEEGMPAVVLHAPGHDHLQLPACHGVQPRTVALPTGEAGEPLLAMAMAVA